ncbi:MAG: ABC transporter substrate-binding protein [Chloroflexi bacterium]|nr:ABC transporter substrate-binding protein [Chloroflexota bacterium]
MKLNKNLLLLVVAILVVNLVAACAQPAAAPTQAPAAQPAAGGKTIKVYASWPMQGSMIPEGTAMLNAAKMALDEVNSTAASYKIELVFLDDASPTTGSWDGQVEAGNAQKAIADDQALVYFGTYNSGAAKISMPLTNKAGMAQITPANSYPGLTKDGYAQGEPGIYRPTGKVNYFRTFGADDLQGSSAAAWAKCLGFKKVYILDDRQLYGKGVGRRLREDGEADRPGGRGPRWRREREHRLSRPPDQG